MDNIEMAIGTLEARMAKSLKGINDLLMHELQRQLKLK